MTGRRIVSISLPHFAMERWLRQAERRQSAPPDDIALVLATEGPHGPVVHATNRAARKAGVQEGARVVDMRALCPDLRVEYADPAGDRAALDRLVLWARRWCPWTAADADGGAGGGAGLVLDTTGSDHLLGGEAAMLADMEARLSLAGLSADLAVAPTWGAAWALARHGGVRQVCAAAGLDAALAPLPVAALRLDAETALLLHRLGLKTIGDLAAIPRLALARRFVRAEGAANPLLRLDQATGRLAEPVSSREAPPEFRSELRLAEPIQDPVPCLGDLCAALCAGLAEKGHGCRKLHLAIYRSDGERRGVTVATSAPSRDSAHLLRLFDGRLEGVDPGFGFDLITLEALAVEPLADAQGRLDGGAGDGLQLSRLIDRLSSRFGARAITRPELCESHVPERAEAWGAALAETVGAAGGTAGRTGPAGRAAAQARPERLFAPPEEVRVLYSVPEGPPVQFIWRRQTFRVARYAGPERIAPEWWRDRPGTRLRDYFRIEDQAGRRFWLYREGAYGDRRGGDPRWFLHGVFA